MRRTKCITVAVLSLMTLAAAIPSLAGAETLPYLFDQLKRPAYRNTIDGLFHGQRIVAWFAEFLKDGNGVATPGETVVAGGSAYELYAVCQPHNCGGNFVYILLTSGGGHAWALSMVDGGDFHYYGNPDAAKRKALTDAAAH